jgi:ADP-heptose:LPS heptosyltransferase
MVAADTGPLHIAAAVGAPCVGLFGPMPHERNGPYGQRHIALQVERLTGGSRERRTADNATMRAISVDLVAAACEAILSRGESTQRSEVA